MKKTIAKEKTAKSELGARKVGSSLVSRKPIDTVPVVLGGESIKKRFKEQLKEITGADTISPVGVRTTPEGKHLVTTSDNQCGFTPGGGALIFSPSNQLVIEETTPSGNHKKNIKLCLLRRKSCYQPKMMSSLHAILENETKNSKSPIAAKATKKTRDSQPKRKTQRSEKSAVGTTATALVLAYFEKQGARLSEAEIKKMNWNLCHLLSYGIAKNAIGKKSGAFDTQIKDNLYSGTRALNVNMMRIENALLQMIQENAVKEIEYIALHSEYGNTHILSSLTLKINMLTHDNRSIQFSQVFDVADERKQSIGNATAYYAFLESIIETTKPSPASSGFFSPQKESGSSSQPSSHKPR